MIKYFCSFLPSTKKHTRSITTYTLSCGKYSKTIYINSLCSINDILDRVKFKLNNIQFINSDELEIYTNHFLTKELIIISNVQVEQKIY